MSEYSNYITKEGVKYFHRKRLEPPKREDYFVVTGEIKFGNMYQDTGYFDDEKFMLHKEQHEQNFTKKCSNKSGYFCKGKTCTYPKCLSK